VEDVGLRFALGLRTGLGPAAPLVEGELRGGCALETQLEHFPPPFLVSCALEAFAAVRGTPQSVQLNVLVLEGVSDPVGVSGSEGREGDSTTISPEVSISGCWGSGSLVGSGVCLVEACFLGGGPPFCGCCFEGCFCGGCFF